MSQVARRMQGHFGVSGNNPLLAVSVKMLWFLHCWWWASAAIEISRLPEEDQHPFPHAADN